MMAVFPICSNVTCKDQIRPMTLTGQCERGVTADSFSTQKVNGYFGSSVCDEVGRRWDVTRHAAELCLKERTRQGPYAFYMSRQRTSMSFQATVEKSLSLNVFGIDARRKSNSVIALLRNRLCMESTETSTNKRQLRTLHSYFSKLQNEAGDLHSSCMPQNNSEIKPDTEEFPLESSSSSQLPAKLITSVERGGQLKTEMGIASLDDYFEKLNTGISSPKKISSSSDEETVERNLTSTPLSVSGRNYKNSGDSANNVKLLDKKEDDNGSFPFGDENFHDLESYDEASDLYLISLLASINIAVFLFEIASPIRNSDVEQLSLPLIYGAKINQLILDGEWWRLVTPMFLHSGFLHVALGCWVLLTFGPQVSKGYGPFTFFLIYILGGISGNLSSFFHTPEATVGGTGPVFAILGAWFIYQIQNKEMTAKEAETMFRNAVVVTVLSFVLSNFERIDDWTHLGATCAGLVYGLLTCPMLELDDASSKNGREEGIALIRRQSDPCKSLVTFAIFIAILSSFIFLFQPELNTLELDSFVQKGA